MTRFFSFIFLLTVLSCKDDKPKTAVVITRPVEHVEATSEQKARRAQSEAYCTAHDIPVYMNPNAMFVNSEDSTTLRTQDDVVDRAMALCYIGLKSEGLEQKHLDNMYKKYNLALLFTKKEMAYVAAKNPAQQQTSDANWRYESLHVLLWALGFIDSLSYPDKVCNVADDVKFIASNTEAQFRQKAKLRSKKEILDQADLILRIHWACEEARLKNAAPPGNVNNDVVMERHYSLNWLIRYLEQAWDDVTTDT